MEQIGINLRLVQHTGIWLQAEETREGKGPAAPRAQPDNHLRSPSILRLVKEGTAVAKAAGAPLFPVAAHSVRVGLGWVATVSDSVSISTRLVCPPASSCRPCRQLRNL